MLIASDEDRDDLFNDIIARIKFGQLTRAEEFAELRRLQPKDHRIREAVNELRDIAKVYHGTEQLRARISGVVCELFGTKETDESS